MKIPIEEIIEAFNEMKSRNPNIYRTAREKGIKATETETDSETDSDWKELAGFRGRPYILCKLLNA